MTIPMTSETVLTGDVIFAVKDTRHYNQGCGVGVGVGSWESELRGRMFFGRSWSRSRSCFFSFDGVGVDFLDVQESNWSWSRYCFLRLRLRFRLNQTYTFVTASQMHQTNKQACAYTVNTFPKTVSLFSLNLKRIKNGFCLNRQTKERIYFL